MEDVVEGGAWIEEMSRMIGRAERLDGALCLQGSGGPLKIRESVLVTHAFEGESPRARVEPGPPWRGHPRG